MNRHFFCQGDATFRRAGASAGVAATVTAGVAAIVAACSGPRQAGPADLILAGGPVITLDGESRVAEAVAVRGDRVVAVGTVAEIEALVGPGTEHVDLAGRTVTPGLMDAHVHFASGGANRIYRLDLSYPNVENIGDVQRLVAEQAERLGEGEWVRGGGWDEGKLEELRYIQASDLDAVAAEHPVWLSHTMGHYGVANSLALEMAGITADTPDPPGGTIDRDADGKPTGVLKESAQGLVSRLVPGPGPAQQREGIRSLADAFNAECMTGGKDPGIGPGTWDAYRDVLAGGDLSVRIFALWRGRDGTIDEVRAYADSLATFTRPYESTGDDRLISGGVKLYIDGSGGARTAWLHEDWNREHTHTDTGNRGYPTMDPDELRRRFRAYHDAGLHVSIHSIGDRAIDWTVDSFVEALEATPTRGLRHGIIHSNIPTDRALDLMAELQRDWGTAYPEPSPSFTWWIGDTYAGNFGPERALRLNPLRSYQERGMIWASGSDYFVTPFPARYGVWASVARQPLLGVYGPHPYGTAQAVDVETALRSFTTWTAHQMFLEDEVGTIEPGKYADLAVWDRNPLTVPTDDLRDMVCEMTVFNGEVVFERDAGSALEAAEPESAPEDNGEPAANPDPALAQPRPAANASPSEQRQRTLLLWGRAGPDRVQLDPAVVVHGAASLPESPGPYRIEGHGPEGQQHFSFTFVPAIEAETGQGQFVFTLPVDAVWAGSLARITLSGPAGSDTLDDATDQPIAVISDRETGRIRAILRGADALEASDARERLAAGAAVSFSRGLPDAAALRGTR
ncbi:MAG: amidohydrolase [Gemmatimonadetes bacterium]|nr:amidohydrolase [Gemmatimonadota bacterium]MCY3678829.1 amidohydrolase [Gemmatimonadota bacterium]